MPRVEERADSVLRNVKRRGAQEGEVMDASTEAMLRPQVLQEALARELVASIQTYVKQQQAEEAERAKASAQRASPFHVAARWDQVPADAIEALLDDARGVSVVDGFLSPGWSGAGAADAGRMVSETDRFTRLAPHRERMAWADEGADEAAFPAVAEVVRRLQGVSFELVAKLGWSCVEPRPHSSLLLAYPADGASGSPMRRDGGYGGDDAGYRLSCVLMLGGDDGVGGCSHVLAGPGCEREVPFRPGRLILFRSRQVQHRTCPATAVGKGAGEAQHRYLARAWVCAAPGQLGW